MKRRLLAIYLDFLVFGVPWAFVEHFVLHPNPEWQRLLTPAKLVTFTILELLVHKIIRWSPGDWLLGLHRPDRPFAHWLPTLVGVLLLLEGTKGLVRWMFWTPPSPLFGQPMSADAWPWIAVAFGAVECVLAYLFFRMRPAALYGGAAYFVIVIISTVMSWPLWDAWAALNTTRRRAYQGIPLRDGEIEQMQAIMPEGLLAGLVVYLLVVVIAGILIVRRRRTLAT